MGVYQFNTMTDKEVAQFHKDRAKWFKAGNGNNSFPDRCLLCREVVPANTGALEKRSKLHWQLYGPGGKYMVRCADCIGKGHKAKGVAA